MMKKRNFNLQIILCLALGSEIFYIVLAALENLKKHILLYLLCYGAVFLLYWITALLFFDFNFNNQSSSSNKIGEQTWSTARINWLNNFFNKHKYKDRLPPKEILTIGIFFGLIFRVTVLFTTPSLSEDIYRYMWDGKVASHGINPFQYAPNADSLSSLRDNDIYPKINHKEISTVYPPVNQLIFSGLYKLYPSIFTFRFTFVLFDLLTALILFLIIKNLSINLNRLLIYLWNPLVIVEFTSSGHADVISIFFLTVTLLFLLKNRLHWANLVLVLSFLSKFISIIFLPVIAVIKKENKLIVILLFVILSAAFYLPYADVGGKLFTGLLVYSSKWQFNGSLFSVIFSAVKSIIPEKLIVTLMIEPFGYGQDAETLASRGTDLALLISKAIIVLIYAGIFGYYLKRFKKDLAREGNILIFKLGVIFMGMFILLNPTVHPWYVCWLVPLLVVVPNRAWVLLTGLIGLSYWILIEYTRSGIWQESTWVKWVEYSPFYLLLIYDWLKTKNKSISTTKSKSLQSMQSSRKLKHRQS